MTKGLSSGRAGRLIFTGIAVIFFIVAGAPAAQAAKRHVGVSLTGASAGTIHEAISTVLRHHGFEAVQADLGSGDSDDTIAAAAKQSHLAAVIVGEVRDGGKRLKLRVYGAAGNLIGEGSWAEGGGARKLAAAVERTLWTRVGGALSKAHAGGEKAERAEKAEKAEAEAAQDNDGKTSTYSHSKDTEASSGADEGDGSHKHKKHKASEDAEEEPAGPTGAAATALDFAPSLRFLSRSLSWNPTVASLRGYTLSLAPSVGLVAAWYPAAHFRGGWPSNLGIGLNLEYTPGLQSQTSDGSRYPTSESDFEGDLRYRFILGGAGQLALLVGGGQHSFIFHSSATSMRSNLADLPDVQYTYARAGLDARFNLPASFAFMISGAYRYVLNAGKDNYLIESSSYLGSSSFVAFDVSAGVGYRFLSMLEARAGFDLRRYQISAAPMNTPGVSSATDQYTALWLRIAVLLDGVAAGEGGAAAPPPPKTAPAASDDQKDDQKGDEKGADKDDKKGADE